jgi:hypothetical protein
MEPRCPGEVTVYKLTATRSCCSTRRDRREHDGIIGAKRPVRKECRARKGHWGRASAPSAVLPPGLHERHSLWYNRLAGVPRNETCIPRSH